MIFIAEDNEVLLQGLTRALSANGYAVHATSTGTELIAALESATQPPVLLLVDLMMPEKDGLEVVETVRGDERWRDIPILVLTAATQVEMKGNGLAEHGVQVLFKPFRLKELLEHVARLTGTGRSDRVD